MGELRTARYKVFSDFLLTAKRPLMMNQSKIDCIHSSLFGIAPLRMRAASCSVIHLLLVVTDWTSVLNVIIRNERIKNDGNIQRCALVLVN
jgi:hypothetical protein